MTVAKQNTYGTAQEQARLLAHCKRLLIADLPESGSFLENLVTTLYVPCQDWQAAAWACEMAGDAWKHLELRERAAENYGQAATFYETVGHTQKALEMRSMANDVQDALYL